VREKRRAQKNHCEPRSATNGATATKKNCKPRRFISVGIVVPALSIGTYKYHGLPVSSKMKQIVSE